MLRFHASTATTIALAVALSVGVLTACKGEDAKSKKLAPAPANATLGDMVGSAATIHVHAPARELDVTDRAAVTEILAALGPTQVPTHAKPPCATPHRLEFRAAGGAALGVVALCDDAGLDEHSKSAARIERDGDQRGVTVRDLGALRMALAPSGIQLP